MNSAFVLRLGSGAAAKLRVGSKAALLDQAARAGLAVPKGVILRDTVADLAVLHGAVVQTESGLRIIDPAKLMELLQLPDFEGEVAVRSAFSAEDTESRSFAGYFRTELNIDAGNPVTFSDALEKVWASARAPHLTKTAEFASEQEPLRRDVLVMRMVNAERAGAAFSEREFEDDLVNHTHGTAERLLAGEIAGESITLPKLRGWEKSALPAGLPPWAVRLQRLLRDIRRWLGNQDWDVEWADDGKVCWLVQLRPITRPTVRDEAFSIANHKEILPHLPSPFMTSLVESCSLDLYSYYREFDLSLPKSRPFLEVFHGRPYINLSLMAETMRHWGLPTRLVTDNIGGTADKHFGLNLRRLIDKTLHLTLLRQAVSQIFSVRSARTAARAVEEKMNSLDASLAGQIEAGRWLYTMLVRRMFALLAASGPIVSLLAYAGVLSELSARHMTISTEKFLEQDALRALVASSPGLKKPLGEGRIPEDGDFVERWTRYMERFGHRGTFESDLSRPRDSECPADLLQSLTNPPLEPTPRQPLTLKARLLWPLWLQASRTIRARELWRHNVMRGFAIVREGLLREVKLFVDAGVIPDENHFWLLRIDEARRLADGWIPEPGFWQARQHEIAALSAIDPPDLLRRFGSEESPGPAPDDIHLRGIPLTRSERTGKAWVLHEPRSVLPEGFKRETTVLVARSVDVGWVKTFGLVCGVVVETGGHLSHGSIILREIGLPAVTNVAGATRLISTGDPIALNAGRGLVTRLNKGGLGLDTPEPR